MSVVMLAKPGLVYHCARCQKWYRKGVFHCVVLHEPGDCCHYGDEEVHEPRPASYQDRDPAKERQS